MKIRPVGADLFYADGQVDRHDGADSRFSKFCKRVSMVKVCYMWNIPTQF